MRVAVKGACLNQTGSDWSGTGTCRGQTVLAGCTDCIEGCIRTGAHRFTTGDTSNHRPGVIRSTGIDDVGLVPAQQLPHGSGRMIADRS